MLEERRHEHVALTRNDPSIGVAQTRLRVRKAGDLPIELARMPDIVLVAEGEKIVVALAGRDRFPQPAGKVRVNSNAIVEFDELNRAIGEIRNDCSNVGTVRPIGADEDFYVPMALGYERFELARQEIRIRPVKAENDENTTILIDGHNS
jgi:hypothetical protein